MCSGAIVVPPFLWAYQLPTSALHLSVTRQKRTTDPHLVAPNIRIRRHLPLTQEKYQNSLSPTSFPIIPTLSTNITLTEEADWIHRDLAHAIIIATDSSLLLWRSNLNFIHQCICQWLSDGYSPLPLLLFCSVPSPASPLFDTRFVSPC